MEIRDYFRIIKQNWQTFGLVVILFLVLGGIFLATQKESFAISLTVNITRKGAQITTDYKFDDLYRLQADEKFAETIVGWLMSPIIAKDILDKAQIKNDGISLRGLSRKFKAEKISSQIVAVNFSTANKDDAGRIAKAIIEELSDNTEKLNQLQQENNWFSLSINDPVIVKNIYSFKVVIPLMLILGIFFAFWVIMLVHYWK
ncbi:MAG: hypothetical protein COU40_01005 [Candidatus Moranbacteria bacterium CG10_big_fil_rev_8_21_14_0_10_35_21]|nr:MAG: hypothetical protein COU40_01005 [Candidatus Moranbacteria bacterium CG10_big_fil_rev_8_21_14_0_10_35_21]PJA88678.1 MAG: hypothetical protein CO139_01790 [Candidatus Moranbacteria bacterium CG_4_9_14_3_um_filter_36_9]